MPADRGDADMPSRAIDQTRTTVLLLLKVIVLRRALVIANVGRHLETFEALKAFHDRLMQLANAIRFNKRDLVNLHRVALYGTMLEFTGCMIHLIEH